MAVALSEGNANATRGPAGWAMGRTPTFGGPGAPSSACGGPCRRCLDCAAMRSPPSAWHGTGMGLAWLLGVALQLQERVLMHAAVYPAALGLGMLAVVFAWRWQRGWVLVLAGMVAAGAGASGWHAQVRLADELPLALEDQDVQVVGVVA